MNRRPNLKEHLHLRTRSLWSTLSGFFESSLSALPTAIRRVWARLSPWTRLIFYIYTNARKFKTKSEDLDISFQKLKPVFSKSMRALSSTKKDVELSNMSRNPVREQWCVWEKFCVGETARRHQTTTTSQHCLPKTEDIAQRIKWEVLKIPRRLLA